MFHDLFFHWVKKMKQINWQLYAKISKRFLNEFQFVFLLKMNKTDFMFNFYFLEMNVYFMFFDSSGFLKRVWKWWFINNVFFKIFDLSGLSKRVLKNDKFVCDDDNNNNDDENNNFQWFLNLNRFFKTRLKNVRFVINNF